MKTLLILLALTSTAIAKDYVYEGQWVTYNRPLNGIMTCIMTPIGNNQYKGRFYGIWQGVSFDYTVDFTGKIDQKQKLIFLSGQANIDGSPYEWRAWVNKNQMKANFTGSRYNGCFDLKRKQ